MRRAYRIITLPSQRERRPELHVLIIRIGEESLTVDNGCQACGKDGEEWDPHLQITSRPSLQEQSKETLLFKLDVKEMWE